MVILGTRISLSDDFIDKAVAKRAEKATTDVNDPQLELALLRVCGGVPKMSFSFRTCKPTASCDAIRVFDNAVTATLEDIVGAPLTQSARDQAALPIASGGLGVRKCLSIAPAAYLGSLADGWKLISEMVPCAQPGRSVDEAISMHDDLTEESIATDWENIKTLSPYAQKQLTEQVDNHILTSLFSNTTSIRDKARLLSISLPHSGDWLSCVPLAVMCACCIV